MKHLGEIPKCYASPPTKEKVPLYFAVAARRNHDILS